jgi:hypothetical protein
MAEMFILRRGIKIMASSQIMSRLTQIAWLIYSPNDSGGSRCNEKFAAKIIDETDHLIIEV